MYLYLRDNKLTKRVPYISLDRCFRPSVGTFLEDRIEPAIWFKVLVIDSMFVDCDRRNVFWSTDGSVAAKELHKIENHNLEGQVVSDFFKDKGIDQTHGFEFVHFCTCKLG